MGKGDFSISSCASSVYVTETCNELIYILNFFFFFFVLIFYPSLTLSLSRAPSLITVERCKRAYTSGVWWSNRIAQLQKKEQKPPKLV